MFKNLVSHFPPVFALSVLLLLSIFGIFDDTLFFNSDLKSIFWFTCCVSLILTVFLLLITMPLIFLRKGVQQIRAIPALVVMAMIASNALFFLVSGTVRHFFPDTLFVNNNFRSGLIFLWVVFVILFLLGISRSMDRDSYVKTTNRMAAWFAGASVFLLIFMFCFDRITQPEAAKPPKRVLFILLDEWPTQYIHTFNPTAKNKSIDDFLNHALVFRNVHTVQPYTHGYFTTLYRATPGALYETSANRPGSGKWDLLSTLQRRGVDTRWLTYHQIGVPDVKGITGYRGFRSMFLSEEYDFFLNALGLDFNAVLPTPANGSLLAYKTRTWLFAKLNTYKEYKNPLTEVLVPELRLIREKRQPTFLIFHVLWQLGQYNIPAVWEKWTIGEERQKILDNIRRRDNRYSPTEEWFAQETTAENAAIIDTVSEKLIRFFTDARKEKLLENTLVFLVADHGYMSSSGRYWYGYHPNEEITRVPVIIFNSDRVGKDNRLFETIDVCRTIVEYFGEKKFPNPRAVSLFSGVEKPYTGTLTLRSDLNREWFLVIHKKNLNYQFNLHPDSEGEAEKFLVDQFSVKKIATGPDVLKEVLPEFEQLMSEYRINGRQVHSNYRSNSSYVR